MINFACPCGKSLKVADESAGKKIKCPGCGKVAVVPAVVPAGDVDQETAALPGADSQEAAGDGPTDSLTCDLNATLAPAGLARREDTQQNDRAGTPAADDAGETWSLGGYRILRELGHGGMGTVYEAEDIKLERRVSLKVMKPEIASNPQHRERFLREACTAASVESVFICPIYEVGEDNGVPFIAMPFLKGEPLNGHWKKNQRLASDEVVRIGKDVAEGLSAAHEAGLVHRDIKPANIWLETQPSGPPRAMILDFGLARMQADNAQISQSGAIIGTPAYMSPEQARGNKNLDARTDLFSLGCVLYALCTGELPFQGATMMDALLALATHDPAPPHTIAATIPRPLSELILRLLAKKVNDRPQTAREVIAELAAIEKDLAKRATETRTERIKLPGRSGSKTVPISQDADKTEVISLNAAPSAPVRKTSYALYTLIAVGLLGCVIPLAGGGIYYVVTDKGTIEIRTEDEKVQVVLLKNGQEIEILDGAGKKTWSIRTGAYTVRLKDDPEDLEIVMPDTFEMKRGGKQIVTIRKLKLTLAQRFPAVLRGEYKFADNAERLEFAQFAFDQKKFAVATRLWAEAFASDAKLGADRETQHNYKAARAAALAAAGQGKDEPPLDVAAKAKLRGQARDWLKAELTDWSKVQPRLPIALALSQWQEESDLAGIRDKAALAKLPAEELKACTQLWADAAELQTKAERGFRALPPLEQVEEVRRELKKRNPAYDGTLTPTIEKDAVTGLEFKDNPKVSDLTPLRGMPLKKFRIHNSEVTDLTALKGMPLESLSVWAWSGSDLTPLKGMPLKSLNCGGCNRKMDLTPLAGMPLEFLCVNVSQVSNLAPLKDLPLTQIMCSNTQVSDLSPLRGMRLQLLHFENCKVSDLAPLKGMPLTDMEIKGTSVTNLSPLKDLPLKTLNCDFQAPRDGRILSAIKTLATLNGAPAENFLKAERFQAMFRREDQPADNAERLAFGQIGYDQKKFVFATRLWAEALASDPKLGDDRQTLHRYNAVRAAALAAAGESNGDLPLNDADKAMLRGQALGWLKAELAAWGKVQPRLAMVQSLWRWQQDSDLAGIRDKPALDNLPAKEQQAFTQLWADVAKAEEPIDDAERLAFAQVLCDRLMDADEKQFAFFFARLKDRGEQGLSVLTGEIGKTPLLPVHSDWTVRFYKWEKIGDKTIPADWDAVLKSPILDEVTMPGLHLVDMNLPPKPATPKVPEYYFAVVATTEATLGEGAYTIRATSDDGVRVWLDHEVVIENWQVCPPTTKTASIVNKPGRHIIKVEFFQAAGWYVLDVDLTNSEEALAKRQANAAVALLRMGQSAKVWPLLKHSPDPRARSYLIHRLALLGADADAIVTQLDRESDPMIRQALLLSLGEFSEKDFTPDDRKALLPKLQEMYRTATDPGLHAASEWLLRQWKQEAWLKVTDQAWAGDRQQQLKKLEAIQHELKMETRKDERRWYVNGQGQTLVAIPGPVEFWMGSPATEEGREAGPEGKEELRHWRRIGRSFAIASKEVTVEQFLRYRKDHSVSRQHIPSDDCPVNMVSWYDAAAYCNWLSEQEGIPKDQWCYEPNKEGKYDQGMKMAANYFQRTGYRLPTDAEWEFSCRAGAVTRYSFGESDELLPRYAWYQKNGQNKSWPVGSLKPNDLGLFDMHGNDWEWCQDAATPNGSSGGGKAIEDTADITNSNNRVQRGGSTFGDPAPVLRSARRNVWNPPSFRQWNTGFRPARTLPFSSLDRYAAARAAVLAAAGQGKNEPLLDDAAKAKLRRQALEWLKAELTGWSLVQPPRLFVARNLWQWQQDGGLAGIRDKAALAKLPAEEQKAFNQLWTEVAKTAEPANSAERLEFARFAVLSAAGQGKDDPQLNDAAKAKLRGQALDWLKAELTVAADRAGKANVIAAAVSLDGALEKLADFASNDGVFQAELTRHFAERGNTLLANAARTKARAWFEGKLAKEPENSALAAELADLLLIDTTRWIVLTPTEMKSKGGATLTRLDDHSVLASGTNPDQDSYTISAKPGVRSITAIRLEALPDPSLPSSGPGRNGNFALSEMELVHKEKVAEISGAIATYDQPGSTAENAVDGNKSTGWHIWPKVGQAHSAYFLLKNPITMADTDTIKVNLHFETEQVRHTLGRFRLSVSDDPHALVLVRKQLPATKITDPWFKLAAAYLATGHNDEAVPYFGKALEGADGYEAKKAICAHVVSLDKVVEALVKRYPAEAQLQLALARNLAARGTTTLPAAKPAEALAALKQAEDIFTRLLASREPWTVLTPVEMKTENGSKLELQKDGSVFVRQPAKKDTYTLVFQTELKGIKGLRLEALTDPRLPNGGPGWFGGNFVLNELTLQAAPAKTPDQPRSIALRNASADFSQQGWEIRAAVDGNSGTGWAVWPEVGKDHTALFDLAEEVGDGQASRLTVRLHHQHGDPRHLLGRFRLSFTTDAATLQATRIRSDLKDGEVVDLNLALAKAHSQQGQTNEAIAAFARALALAKDRAGKARIIAEAASLAGVLEKLAESVPADGHFQAELSRHFSGQGNKPLAHTARTKARALFDQQLAKEPENAALASDLADLLLSAVNAGEHFWIDDAAPSGAKLYGDTPWEWVGKPDHPVFRGQRATRRQAQGLSQHYFAEAAQRLKVGHGAKLFAYVFLDPKDPPKTVMLQFNDGSWDHRAVWGEDLIPWGTQGKESRLPMGPLPKAGEWVRLEVEAARVGLHAGAHLNGWAFTQHGGTCYWDAAGCTNSTTSFDSPWLTLANAYAVTGENERAVQYASKALKAAGDDEAKKAVFDYLVSADRIFDALVKLHAAEPQLQLALARNLTARGTTALAAKKSAEALAALKQAQDIFTRLLAPREGWTVLTPVEMKTEKGSRLELEKDGSVFAQQPARNDTYTLVFQTELKGIKGLRLEALADSRLPGGGPGWEGGGNFVLSELSLQAALAGSPDQPKSIALRNASADYSQWSYEVRGAVDGNAQTGWAGGWAGKDRTAVFDTAEDVGDGQAMRLTVRLSHEHSAEKFLLGRFRLSFATDAATLQATRIRLDLKDSELIDFYAALGTAHAQQGQSDDAVAAYTRALALAKDRAGKAGIFTEASALKGVLERLAERADNSERVTFAQIAHDQKKFAFATRLWAEALTIDPKLSDDRQTQPRYAAARAAALAAAGQGKDEPPLDDATKAKLRGQALGWLKAERTAWTELLESGAPGWGSARWVWDQANANSVAQTDEPRYLRQVFTLAAKPQAAELWIAVDNEYTVYLNGQEIGTGAEWSKFGRYDVAKHLIAGKNLLAIRAQNRGGVAGAIARLHVVTTDKKDLFVGTDDQTRITQTANPHWLKSDFDDRAWPKAVVLGDAGLAPWSIANRDPKEEARRLIVQTLWQWQHDSDLAGIRDKAALAKLPADEQRAFTHFWADIAKAAEPADNAERLTFAQFAYDHKKFAAATRLWAEALASDPKLSDDTLTQHRYNAARAAALAAAGHGKDEPPLDGAAKAKFRGQALEWLKAELTACSKLFDSGPPLDRPAIVAKLSEWQQNSDLAGVREGAALARLPADEQKEWQALWARVPELRPVVPTSKEEGQKWRYTTGQPAEGWQKADFDDKQWQEGVGAFGTKETAFVRTEWKTDDIWLRREFTMPEGSWDDLLLVLNHDEDAEVYVNGVLAQNVPGWSGGNYLAMPLSAESRRALNPGKNVFAVHCRNTVGVQFIDVGIVAVKNNAGRLALAQLAYDRTHFGFATQLWAEALANDPKLGDDRQAGHRYNAARAAALAAAGQGVGEPPLDDAAKAKRRGQALDWLKAELTVWTRLLESGAPQDRPTIVQTLSRWKRDGDLAGVRDIETQAKLSADEQKKWQGLWAEVEADFARAEALASQALAKQPSDADAASTLAIVLLERVDPGWRLVKPSAVKSEEGTTLTVQGDGSVLASDPSPDRDVYVIETEFHGRIGAIRLEVVPDLSMPAGGSGRSPGNGNFVLTDFRVMAGESVVTWSRALADFSQEKFAIAFAIDADESTGWAIHPRCSGPHWAVFIPSKPITAAGKTPLTIRLAFRSKEWAKHTLGRFRLSVTDSDAIQHAEWFAAAATPHAKLGAAYLALGDFRRAADFLTKATAANPNLPATDWLVLALAHAKLKEPDQARKACGKAAELLKPADAEAPAGAEAALRPLLREVVIAVGPNSPEATALIAAAAGEPPAALNEAIGQNPDKAAGYRDRGNWFAERGRWKEASADLTEVFRLEPDTFTGMHLGILLAHTGEIDRYRAHCLAMLERWASTENNGEADRTLKMNILLPDFKADAKQLARLAEVAVAGDKNVDWFEWWMFAKGLHDYRTGKYADALATCRASRLRAPTSKGPAEILTSLNLAIEAMALHRSGDEAGAKRALAEARSNVDVNVPGIDGGGWSHDWLAAHILYREAERLIAGKKAEPPK